MIGLGTYAFYWQVSDANPKPMSLIEQFEETKKLGCNLFQIIDYKPLDEFDDAELSRAAASAKELGLTIELGTRGVEVEHLNKYLELAKVFGAKLIRSMVFSATSRPTLEVAQNFLKTAMPAYEANGVQLALETYEQVSTQDLVALVKSVASPNLGVCLDPANVVARLETPSQCVALAAPLVKNIHVKDFAFSREDGWVGFKYSGAPMGEGLHDYSNLLKTVLPRQRGINEIVEHWLPWAGSIEATIALEKSWTNKTLEYLRSTNE